MSSNAITAGILLAINQTYQPHVLVFRLNVIVMKASRGTVRSAPNGCPDIIGVLRGRPIVIEVKYGRDTLRPAQVKFRDQWIKAGGAYVLARSVEQAMQDIETQIKDLSI